MPRRREPAVTTGPATPVIDVRSCSEADWLELLRVDELAFGYTWRGGAGLADDPDTAVFEIDRALMARLDGEPAGVAGAYTLRLSVPGGGEVPTGGVTWVGVLPTARRRGVLTALMRHQLDQIHAAGEPVAALWSAEPGIYGRFGYGLASRHYSLTVGRGHGALSGPEDPALRARIVSAADPAAETGADEVYTAVRSVRPGIPARDTRWWARCTYDPVAERGGASELRCLLVTGPDGRALAYATFTSKEDWQAGSAENRIDVREALSSEPAAGVLLWRTLLSYDLVGQVAVHRLPVDDPLLHHLVDPRRARPELKDALFVRLVDLPAALLARGYDEAWQGVVEVEDLHCPWNAGRWRLSLGPGEAGVERTDLEPDLVLDVRELGGAYLGGTSLAERAAAGLLREVTPGAVAGLGRAMRSEPAPFSPYSF